MGPSNAYIILKCKQTISDDVCEHRTKSCSLFETALLAMKQIVCNLHIESLKWKSL